MVERDARPGADEDDDPKMVDDVDDEDDDDPERADDDDLEDEDDDPERADDVDLEEDDDVASANKRGPQRPHVRRPHVQTGLPRLLIFRCESEQVSG